MINNQVDPHTVAVLEDRGARRILQELWDFINDEKEWTRNNRTNYAYLVARIAVRRQQEGLLWPEEDQISQASFEDLP